MPKFLVIDDHALVRAGLMQALQGVADCGAVETFGAATADEALAVLEQTPGIDLALLDLMLPGTGGLALLGALRRRFADLRILILSAQDDDATVQRTLRAGAAGFVSKSEPTDHLLDAVRRALDGERTAPLPDNGERRRKGRNPTDFRERFGLTGAQMRVLELLIEGKTNREIGDLIGVTEGTVKIHVSAVLRALKVSNRSQAMLAATQNGLKVAH